MILLIYGLSLVWRLEIVVIGCLVVIVPWHLGWPKPYPVTRPGDPMRWRD